MSCCRSTTDVHELSQFYEDAKLVNNNCVVNNRAVVKRRKKGDHLISINNYKVKRALGEGRFGEVYLCTCFSKSWLPRCLGGTTKEEYAIKVVRRKHAVPEYKILVKVQHEHIVRLLEYIDDKSCDQIFMVFEVLGKPIASLTRDGYLEGGQSDCWEEAKARTLFTQMVAALRHLHKIGVFHLDIKPENIVYASKDRNRIKLIDFGESRMLKQGVFGDDSSRMTKGTPFFQAPECLTGYYYPDKSVDVWALGVLFYLVLVGYVPFGKGSRNQMQLYAAIETEELIFPAKMMGTRVNDLIQNMLNRDLSRRLTLPAVSNHVWFTFATTRSVSKVSILSLPVTQVTGTGTGSGFTPHFPMERQLTGLVLEGFNPEANNSQTQDNNEWSFRGDLSSDASNNTPAHIAEQAHSAGLNSSRSARDDTCGVLNPLSPGVRHLKNASAYATKRPGPSFDQCNPDSPIAEQAVPDTSPHETGLAVPGSPLGALLKVKVPRLLVVDDIHYGRYILCRMLQKIALPVKLGEKALALFEAVSGKTAIAGTLGQARAGMPYDLVILDLFLPDMHGLHAVTTIREAEVAEKLEQTPIIIATTEEEMPLDINERLEKLSARLIIKPFSIQQVRKVLNWLGVRTRSDVDDMATAIARPRHLADTHYLANSQARSYSQDRFRYNTESRFDLSPSSALLESGNTASIKEMSQRLDSFAGVLHDGSVVHGLPGDVPTVNLRVIESDKLTDGGSEEPTSKRGSISSCVGSGAGSIRGSRQRSRSVPDLATPSMEHGSEFLPGPGGLGRPGGLGSFRMHKKTPEAAIRPVPDTILADDAPIETFEPAESAVM